MDKFRDECGVFGIFGHPEAANLTYLGLYALATSRTGERGHRVRRWPPGAVVAGDGRGQRLLRRGQARLAGRRHRHRPRPLLDGRVEPHRERPADARRLLARAVRDRPQRQPGQRQRAARRAGAPGRDLPVHLRHRGHRPPLRAVEGRDGGRRGDRGPHRRPRRLLAGDDHEGSARRRARSARLPAARPRPAGRGRGRLLRDLRARSDRRHLRPRRRAGRGADRLEAGRQVGQAVPAAAALALRLRARLLRAARQLRVRPQRQRGADRVRPPAGARGPGRRRRRGADPGLRRLRRDRLLGGVGHADALRPDPEPLHRPHLHRAAAVDPPFRREDQAERRAQHPRGQARRAGRRLDRPRHDEPQDREADQGGGREGSAHADQLSADDLAVLLRRGHAAPLGADRRDAHHRGDPDLSRGGQPGVPEPAGHARRRRAEPALGTAPRATRAPIRSSSRATRIPTCSSRSSWTGSADRADTGVRNGRGRPLRRRADDRDRYGGGRSGEASRRTTGGTTRSAPGSRRRSGSGSGRCQASGAEDAGRRPSRISASSITRCGPRRPRSSVAPPPNRRCRRS